MSSVWKYFSKDVTDICKAKCNHCGKLVSRGGKDKSSFTTSNLTKHLKHCDSHQNVLKAESLESKEHESIPFASTSQSVPEQSSIGKPTHIGESKQLTLIDTYNKNCKYEKNDKRAKEISRAIAEMLCLNKLPYRFVESEGFKVLMNKICPKYDIPGRKFFSNCLIPEMYEEVRTKISEILTMADEVCITSDLWTSVGNRDYISITAHFHDPDFKKHHLLLEVMPFEGATHSSQLIFENMKTAFAQWNISTKVKAVVTDNAANMVAAVAKLNVVHVGCAAHSVQLVSYLLGILLNCRDLLSIC